METLAVSGATGFIGRRLLPILLASGTKLRLLVRPPINRIAMQSAQITIIAGDLHDRASVAQWLTGADGVIHLAGRVKGYRDSQFFADNTFVTKQITQQVADLNPILPLLMISSLAAREPHLSPYAASKREAESALLTRLSHATIFRPTAVYGPGDRELQPLLDLLGYGIALRIGPKTGQFSLIFVDDLVRAIQQWQQSPVRGIFELCDGETYDWARFTAIATAVRGKPVHQWPLPREMLYGFSYVQHAFGFILKRDPMLTPTKVNELRHHDWSCQNQPLCDALGWQPLTSLAEGLRKTCQWAKSPELTS